MAWFDTFNAVFFLSMSTIACAGIGVVLGFCFKSKCSEFKLCSSEGCIYIRRDVDAENEEIKIERDHMPPANAV